MASLTSSQVFSILFAMLSSLISLLLYGNLFFLRRLIYKVDGIEKGLAELTIEFTKIQTRFLHSVKTRPGGNGRPDEKILVLRGDA